MSKNLIYLWGFAFFLLIGLSFYLSRNFGLIYALPGDSLSLIGLMRELRHGFFPGHNSFPWVLFPGGADVLFGHNFQPLFLALVFLFSFLPLNEVIAYQLFLTTLFFINVLSSAYFFHKIFNGDRLATAFSVIVFAGSLYHQWQLAVHPELAVLFWLPPILFFLLAFLDRPKRSDGIFLFLFLGLQMLTSIQVGYFIFLSVNFLLATRLLLTIYRRTFSVKFLKMLFEGYLVFFATTALIWLNLLRIFFQGTPLQRDWLNLALNRNSFLELVALGARPWDYFLPSIYHPLWGQQVKTFYNFVQSNLGYQFHSVYLPERVNYLTWTAVILSLFALAFIFVRRKSENYRKLFWIFGLASFAFWLSLPPQITFRSFSFYSPSYFLYRLFPFFRVYARAGVLVLLSLAVISGWATTFLPKSRRVFLTTLLLVFIIFENLNFPPFFFVGASKVPDVYGWLKEKTADVMVVEYPKDNSQIDIGGGCVASVDPSVLRDYNSGYEFFYYTYHQKRVLAYQFIDPKDRAFLSSIDNLEAYRVLKKYKVDYLLLHTKDPMIGIYPWPFPQENPLDDCWQRRVMKKPERVYEKLKKVFESDEGTVYQVQ